MSDITVEDVVEEMGYGASRSHLDDHFSDIERTIQERIQAAEDEIERKTGRVITFASSDYHFYNEVVRKLAAVKCLGIVLNNEITQLSYTIEGAIRVDKTERSRRLNSVVQRLARDVEEGIKILKETESARIAVVYRDTGLF